MYSNFGQFIDGQWQQAEKKETYKVINPATEEVLGEASKASSVDVQKALKSAEKGLETWKNTTPWQRSYVIRKIADLMRERKDVLAKWLTLEVGKPLKEAIGEVGAEISNELLESDIIKKVSITGSTRVGKLILKKAADKVQRVTMELSGHSPFIVFDDVDMNKVADMAITAKFRNNGQVCISPNRFYIQETRKEEFVNAFVDRAKKLKIGNGMDEGTDLGPLTTAKRLEEIEKLVETTKSEGAKVVLGGGRPSGFNKGYYFEPTVFDDVQDNFTIMKEEPFGPLVPVLTFKDFDEVVERANNNDLGLCSYLYTNSMDKANRASEMMETGCVAVNTAAVAVAEAPFGGIKQTGYGREGGSMAIKDYLNIKYTHMGLKT